MALEFAGIEIDRVSGDAGKFFKRNCLDYGASGDAGRPVSDA